MKDEKKRGATGGSFGPPVRVPLDLQTKTVADEPIGRQKTKTFFTGGNRGNRERPGCKFFAFSVASVTSCSKSSFLHLNPISNPLGRGTDRSLSLNASYSLPLC
jgi:hypothetical protein